MLDVVFDPSYAQHVTGAGHPERAERLAAFVSGLESGGVSRSAFVAPRAAGVAALAAVHDPSYVALVERFISGLPDSHDALAELPTGDTVVTRASFDIALLAAGGALTAVERAVSGGAPTLAVVRPPGHHAEPERGMGFCVFNNIAVAAQWARANVGPVLIVDYDYHHGNGTQAWVERVLDGGGSAGAPVGFISTHAYPAYPGTGAFRETRFLDGGFVVDIPLPHSTETDDFVSVWASLLPPLAARLKPRVILVSAGFDFLVGDPIAGLPVAPRAVDALSGLIGSVAERERAALAMVLEGGYSLDNLRASGAKLAYDFGKHAGDLHVPEAAHPDDVRLRRMVDEVLATGGR